MKKAFLSLIQLLFKQIESKDIFSFRVDNKNITNLTWSLIFIKNIHEIIKQLVWSQVNIFNIYCYNKVTFIKGIIMY